MAGDDMELVTDYQPWTVSLVAGPESALIFYNHGVLIGASSDTLASLPKIAGRGGLVSTKASESLIQGSKSREHLVRNSLSWSGRVLSWFFSS